uniref:8-oxo-dGTPase n=1 Tax=Chlorobium chlorochromatii (strain CaD3) TaxID=340177 RepID=Q3AQ67_CHLCH
MKPYSYCPHCRTELASAMIDGRDRLHCPACAWVNYLNPLPVAVAYAVNERNELLVIRRAYEPARNEWALPGGFLEIGEDPHHGCLRELHEETALSGTIQHLIGVYQREVEMYGSLLVIAYKVLVSDDSALSINHEVTEAGFYPHEALPTIRIPLHQHIIRDAVI